MTMNRREAVGALAGMGGLLLADPKLEAMQSAAPAASAIPVPHIVPLPFKADSLNGISEKLITSHHDNNYAGAVKNLAKVRNELASLTKDAAPFTVAGLRQSELTYQNSAIFHELYFGNLGGDGRPGASVAKRLGEAFGSLGAFESQFRALGGSLSGGSGWAILGHCFHTGDLRIFWSGHHTQGMADTAPLLVMDMYEHAYQMDYGASAAKYIDAFFQNIQWDEVERRMQRAGKAQDALRG